MDFHLPNSKWSPPSKLSADMIRLWKSQGTSDSGGKLGVIYLWPHGGAESITCTDMMQQTLFMTVYNYGANSVWLYMY